MTYGVRMAIARASNTIAERPARQAAAAARVERAKAAAEEMAAWQRQSDARMAVHRARVQEANKNCDEAIARVKALGLIQ
jgi:hypothetical protein